VLEMLGVVHTIDPLDIDETRLPGEPIAALVQRLAAGKATSGTALHPGRWVLGADTLVVIDGEPLGKPGTAAVAASMLRRLPGRRHTILTAVALARDDELLEGLDETTVWMATLGEDEIAAYVATGEPLDKAGAYGVQGLGAALLDRIDGDFFSVSGLPARVAALLFRAAGVRYGLSS
jgi:septum formation protein